MSRANKGILPVLLLAGCAALARPAGAAETPPWGDEPMAFPAWVPSFGINIHTIDRGLENRRVGAAWVRVGLGWDLGEPGEAGVYNWELADRMIDHYQATGVRMLFLLGMGECAPAYKEAMEKKDLDAIVPAMARWMAAFAERYRGRVDVWEIGNEPECFPMGGIWNEPENYTRLAREACRLIKAADPAARTAVASLAWTDRPFLTKACEAGLLADGTADFVSFHGYHRKDYVPESALAEDLQWLRHMVKRYSPDRPVGVFDSERGYAIFEGRDTFHRDVWRTFSHGLEEQAVFLARHYLEEIYLGVEISMWYKDMWGEHSFSLWFGDENHPEGLRPIGHVFRNLAALFNQNPKTCFNDRYPVTVVSDAKPAPEGALQPATPWMRSYRLRTAEADRLVIAVWHPVEVSDGGQVLVKRELVDQWMEETLRPVTPDDAVAIPVTVSVEGLDPARIRQAYRYDLLARDSLAALTPAPFDPKGTAAVVGPMPTVLVVDLVP